MCIQKYKYWRMEIMKKKSLGLTAFILSLVVLSGLLIIKPMEYPPAVSSITVTSHTSC